MAVNSQRVLRSIYINAGQSRQFARFGSKVVQQCRLSRQSSSSTTASQAARAGEPREGPNSNNAFLPIFGAACTFGLGYAIFVQSRPAFAEQAQVHDDDERLIRLHEVYQHNRDSDSYWVYRGNRVYDITDWIPNHPGGEVIMRAVGGNIDPYWKIFTVHQKEDVFEILEQYFIGVIDPRDLIEGKTAAGKTELEDPFSTDPARDEALVVHNTRPFNAESAVDDLCSFITPTNRFYKRHHMWVPEIDDETFTLKIELPDGEEVEYTLKDLKEKFEPCTITATLQCSGNRRSHMTKGASPTNGIQWGVGAIGNAEWTGVRMRDILRDAGLDIVDLPENVKHVQFVGAEAYGSSVPVEKAVDKLGDVLIAYAMNGKPLTRDHGFPFRSLVPGNVAARSVKWLSKIVLSDEESTSQWQRRDYKCFGPNEGRNPDWDSAVAIQETPVQSAITTVRQARKDQDSELARTYRIEEDSLILNGYAFSGAGRRIVRVDISPDDGKTWFQARVDAPKEKGHRSWSWRQWDVALPKSLLNGNICVKAVDDQYNTQPENFAPYYNVRGNLSNCWHKMPVSEALNSARANA